MLSSELRAQLEALEKEHGDLPVVLLEREYAMEFKTIRKPIIAEYPDEKRKGSPYIKGFWLDY